jgi:hypothetical protein
MRRLGFYLAEEDDYKVGGETFFLQNPLTIKKLYVFLHRLDRPGPRTLLYYALGG